MRTIVLLAGLVSFSLTGAAVAKPEGQHGKHDKAAHGGMEKKIHTRTDGRTVHRHTTNGGRKACPPGLAKKDNGCLPPGQASKRYAVGQRLPSSYNSYNIPEQYRDRYRDTSEDLFRYNDGNVYRIDAQTRLVEEVIRLIGR